MSAQDLDVMAAAAVCALMGALAGLAETAARCHHCGEPLVNFRPWVDDGVLIGHLGDCHHCASTLPSGAKHPTTFLVRPRGWRDEDEDDVG
jgi:hypothetical protein